MDTKHVVLITGCSAGGIGYALCKEFAASGSRVVYATARRLESMAGLAGENIKKLELDVCSMQSIEKAVQFVIDEEGQLDIVVSNAGVGAFGPLLDISLDEAENGFQANYFGSHRLAKVAIPHMAKRGSGKFILVGSIAGVIPGPWNGTYSACKAALHTFADVLRMECAPFGVQVQTLIPGAVKSNIIKNMEGRFSLREDSLYTPWAEAIYKRFSWSQGSSAMPTDTFASIVVREILKTRLKNWFMLGGATGLVRCMMFLPRSWALKMMWRRNSK